LKEESRGEDNRVHFVLYSNTSLLQTIPLPSDQSKMPATFGVNESLHLQQLDCYKQALQPSYNVKMPEKQAKYTIDCSLLKRG
jgi:hypothetical protein